MRLEKDLEDAEKSKNDSIKYRLLSKALDADEFASTVQENKSIYAKNYSEGPITFIPGNNRILFWNGETLIVKVLEYGKKENCVFAHYSY